MSEASQFAELSGLLQRAGIQVRTEPFKTPPDSAGGLCYVFGKKVVLLDQKASVAERARALVEVVERIGLEQLGVSGSDLSPGLLAALNRRGQMAWPHRSQAPTLAKTDSRGKPKVRLVQTKPPLSALTTIQLGGPPDELFTATSPEQILEVAERATRAQAPLHVLGGGSNLVVADSGVSGTVLLVRTRGITIDRQGDRARVTAQAGENWHDFARKMTDLGLAGVECLGGIPGSVGATPIQNVGAYGQQVSNTIVSVRALCRKTHNVVTLTREDCGFAYRSSIFKTLEKDRYIVLDVTFELRINGPSTVAYGELAGRLGITPTTGGEVPLREVFDCVMTLRREKSMVVDPADENSRSCGSFFVNAIIERSHAERITALVGETVPSFPVEQPSDATSAAGASGRELVKIPSAWLIERAGLHRGMRLGNAGLSTKHTLCLVAHRGATAQDIVSLAQHVRAQVEARFGVRLVPEPHFWGFPHQLDGLPT